MGYIRKNEASRRVAKPRRAIFALFRRFWAWIWAILAHFCPISRVLGLDLAHFCPSSGVLGLNLTNFCSISGVLSLDLAHFERFLPFYVGSGPGFGTFLTISALFLGLWAWILPIFGPLTGVLGLELAHFEPFLPLFGSSRPGFGPF